MSKTCSFEGCERKHYAKGLCTGHYLQQWRGEELRPLRKRSTKAEAERLRAQGLKKCCGCDQVKLIEDFARCKSRKDGRNPQCKACQAEYDRQYREANQEKRLEYYRQYYESNREGRRKYYRQWQQENPDKVRANNALRRARKLEATTEEFTPEDVKRIWGENPVCVYCQERPAEHWDHFVPLKLGGRHAVYNLFPACAECNSRKHAKHPYLFLFELMNEEEQAAFIAALEARLND